jgi:Nucleoside-diphosphate-sugar epimerases
MINWKNKKVFVSGGAGVIGTALVNALNAAGAVVLVGDLKPMPLEWSSMKHYREGDLITLTAKEIAEFQPEIYFHLAATFERSIETYDFWEENYHYNIALSHHLMTLLKDLPSLKKIVFASSYLIYDPSLYLFHKAQTKAASLKETSPIAPRNLCGMAKLLHEQELLFITKFRPELQVINARIFRSYGKNSRDIISRWIRALLAKEKICVYRPEGIFDYIFADDVADGLLRLASTDFNGIVNLGSGHARSIHDVVSVLKSHFGNFACETAPSNILFEASQADMSLYHDITGNKHAFLPLEKAIPQIIAYETK